MRSPARHPLAIAPIALALGLVALTGTVAWAAPLDQHANADQRTDQRLTRMARELNLTAEQQTQIRALIDEQHAAIDRLRQETKKRIEALLTDAQRAERDRRVDRRIERQVERMADRLSLSADQSTRIRAIFKERKDDPELTRGEIRERIVAVLTDEQRKEFESMNERRGRRGGPDRGPGPGPDGGPGPEF
jgi:periplasmic protein CpxP/Spy